MPDDVIASIDAQAARLGLSRVEYLRRNLLRDARRTSTPVTPDDLRVAAGRLSGLLDPELMRDAWR